MISIKRKPKAKRVDPVLPDQGGRSMPSDPPKVAALPTEEMIRMRAYQLYEQRGRANGYALEDWIAAKAEMIGHHKG